MFEFFFSCSSDDVVCKVWCRLVKKCGRSRENTVLRFSRFCEKKIIDANGRGLGQKMQRTPVHLCVQVFGLWEVRCGSYSPKRLVRFRFDWFALPEPRWPACFQVHSDSVLDGPGIQTHCFRLSRRGRGVGF